MAIELLWAERDNLVDDKLAQMLAAVGYRIKPFIPGCYHMVDIDTSIAPRR